MHVLRCVTFVLWAAYQLAYMSHVIAITNVIDLVPSMGTIAIDRKAKLKTYRM